MINIKVKYGLHNLFLFLFSPDVLVSV